MSVFSPSRALILEYRPLLRGARGAGLVLTLGMALALAQGGAAGIFTGLAYLCVATVLHRWDWPCGGRLPDQLAFGCGLNSAELARSDEDCWQLGARRVVLPALLVLTVWRYGNSHTLVLWRGDYPVDQWRRLQVLARSSCSD